MRKALLCLLATIGFIIIGFVSCPYILEYSVSFENIDVQFQNTKLSGQFEARLLFALILGSIPILYFIVDYFAKLNFFQGVLSIFVMLGFGYVGWKIQLMKIQAMSDLFSFGENTSQIPQVMNLSPFYFTKYILIGFLTGALISSIAFRFTNKPKW